MQFTALGALCLVLALTACSQPTTKALPSTVPETAAQATPLLVLDQSHPRCQEPATPLVAKPMAGPWTSATEACIESVEQECQDEALLEMSSPAGSAPATCRSYAERGCAPAVADFVARPLGSTSPWQAVGFVKVSLPVDTLWLLLQSSEGWWTEAIRARTTEYDGRLGTPRAELVAGDTLIAAAVAFDSLQSYEEGSDYFWQRTALLCGREGANKPSCLWFILHKGAEAVDPTEKAMPAMGEDRFRLSLCADGSLVYDAVGDFDPGSYHEERDYWKRVLGHRSLSFAPPSPPAGSPLESDAEPGDLVR